MSLTQRVNMILKANLHHALDRAENPERLLALYRRELEDVLFASRVQRERIGEEIRRLEAGPDRNKPGIQAEILALETREGTLAESMAAIGARLGQIQGAILARQVRHGAAVDQPDQDASEDLAMLNARRFEKAVRRFEHHADKAERRFRELEGAHF